MKDFTHARSRRRTPRRPRARGPTTTFSRPKENLIKESNPVFIEGKSTSREKWMEWLGNRAARRTPGYDWCIVRLGLPGVIRGTVGRHQFLHGNVSRAVFAAGCDLG